MRETGSSFLAHCDEHGQIQVLDRKAFHAYTLAHFKHQECVVTVQSRPQSRSVRANNYYWAVVVAAAAQETGQDEDTIHALWCEQFIPNEHKRLEFVNRLTDQRHVVNVTQRPHSSELDGTKFFDFVEDCRVWMQTWLGVTTPDPDPEYWRKRPRRRVDDIEVPT